MSPILGPIVGGIIGIVGALSGAIVGAFIQKYLRERGSVSCDFQSVDLKFGFSSDLRDTQGLDFANGALVFQNRKWAERLTAQDIRLELKANFFNQKDVYTGLRNLHVVFRLKEESWREKLPLPVTGMLPKDVVQGNELAFRPTLILADEIELPDPSWNIKTAVEHEGLKRRWKAINLPPKTWTEVEIKKWATLDPRKQGGREDVGDKHLDGIIPLTAFGSIGLFGQFPNGEPFYKEVAKIV